MAKDERTKRIPRISIPKRFGVLLVTILALAISVVGYFTFYISNQTTYFTNRNFRQLAGIRDQLEDRIDQLKDVFERKVAQTVNDEFENQKAVSDSLSKPRHNADQQIPNALQQTLGNLFVVTEEPLIPTGSDWQRVNRNLGHMKVFMRLITGGETSWLEFVCDILPEHKPEPIRAAAKIRLDQIIGPLVGKIKLESAKGSEHEEGFDSILIASLERTGKTKPSDEASGQNLTSKTIFQTGTPELDIDSLENLSRADAVDKSVDFKTLSRNTGSSDVRLGDTNYKLYVQPIDLPLATISENIPSPHSDARTFSPNDEDSRWVVCGLVEASHFRHETWAFPYTLLITVAFLSVLVALSWPFLKLWFIGPKDRLRLADVYFIGFALLVGGAILTFFMLFAVTYRHSEKELDDELAELSQQIDARFHNEVSAVTDELSTLNQKLLNGESWMLTASTNTRIFRGNILEDLQYDPYPYFNRAAWIDKTGDMRIQWSIDPSPGYVSVKDRDFFKRIMEDSSRGNGGNQFWLEPVTSRLSGDKTVIVSAPFDSKTTNIGNIRVVAMDPVLMSIMHTVMPSGFGFRVIDNSGHDPSDDETNDPGKVIFQSSESQQLKENFFQECDNDHSLRSLVFGRGRDFVDVNYKGESYRLLVAPIKSFPNWSLLVFRNKQPLRTVYLEILTLAGFIFLSYAMILLLVFIGVYIIKTNRDDRTEWIWPSQEMSEVYRRTLYGNILLCLFSALVALGFDGWIALLLSVAAAFGGILLLIIRLRLNRIVNRIKQSPNSIRTNRLLDRGNVYIWNVVALLFLAGVLPAATFFKAAYNEEMRLFIKQGQISLVNGLEERYQRVSNQYSTKRANPSGNPSPFGEHDVDSKAFITKRLNFNRPDVYAGFFFQTYFGNTKEQIKERPDSFLVFLNRYIPLFNETSIEMRGLTRDQAADQLWKWEQSQGDELILHPNVVATGDVHIITPLQRFGLRGWSAVVLGAGFAAIFGILWGLSWFVVRKVFLFDVNENMYLPTIAKKESPIVSNSFIIQSSPLTFPDGSVSAKDDHRIDLAVEMLTKDWLAGVEPRIKSAAKTIVLDHFDYRLKDSALNAQKLNLVEYLLKANKIVLIVSSNEPSAYSFDDCSGDGVDTQPTENRNKWDELLSRFRKLYYNDDDTVIKDASRNIRESLDSAPEPQRKKAMDMAQLIKSECASRLYLQNIAKGIIDQLAVESMESNEVLNQIFDQAESYYQKLWKDCSDGEKLTLFHLAEDRFLSHKDPHIEPLLRKGLMVFSPDVRLMNDTFKRFVLSQAVGGNIKALEGQARRLSYWEAFKVPLFIGFVGVVVFLLLTQKDLYNSSWTLITAATTAIPAFFKLLSLFQNEPGGGAKSSTA